MSLQVSQLLTRTLDLHAAVAAVNCTLLGTITHQKISPRHLSRTGWQCIWTGLLALCHSTVSPPKSFHPNESTSTPSTPDSLNLSTLLLGLDKCSSLTVILNCCHPQFICHRPMTECYLVFTSGSQSASYGTLGCLNTS